MKWEDNSELQDYGDVIVTNADQQALLSSTPGPRIEQPFLLASLGLGGP